MTALFVFLVCLSLVSYVDTNLTMMLVWGTPTSSTNADISTLSWEACVDQCSTAQRCVLAWQNGTSCVNYDYNVMSTVKQTTSVNGSVVAFKVESPSDVCPVGENAPTFNNTNATGSLYIDDNAKYFPKWLYYTIYISGSAWKISYKSNFSCVGTFSGLLERADGSSLCVNAWYSTGLTGFYYNRSVVLCKNDTAELAGLYYPEDVAYWIETGETMRTWLNNSNTYARLDGIRTAACQKTPTTAACMSVSGFTFTGIPPANFDNYNWVTNSGAQATADDNCIVMLLNGTDTGKTDVRSCANSSPLQAGLVYCAAPSWVYGLY